MSNDARRFTNPARARAIMLGALDVRDEAGAFRWVPLADLRKQTGWPSSIENGTGPLLGAARSAAKDGLVEFKSGEFSGRASVRLKVHQPPATPAEENT